MSEKFFQDEYIAQELKDLVEWLGLENPNDIRPVEKALRDAYYQGYQRGLNYLKSSSEN